MTYHGTDQLVDKGSKWHKYVWRVLCSWSNCAYSTKIQSTPYSNIDSKLQYSIILSTPIYTGVVSGRILISRVLLTISTFVLVTSIMTILHLNKVYKFVYLLKKKKSDKNDLDDDIAG